MFLDWALQQQLQLHTQQQLYKFDIRKLREIRGGNRERQRTYYSECCARGQRGREERRAEVRGRRTRGFRSVMRYVVGVDVVFPVVSVVVVAR